MFEYSSSVRRKSVLAKLAGLFLLLIILLRVLSLSCQHGEGLLGLFLGLGRSVADRGSFFKEGREISRR